MSDVINNKRVLKNTAALYVRMGIMMLVTLYTSRVVLQNLGVTDFGIYNIVGGVVVMFSFLSITLEVAIRRFLAVELGKGGEKYGEVFLSSVYAILLVSIVIIIGLETIGLWLVNYRLDIPLDRLTAANWTFQLSILTFLLNFSTIPFSASIVAHERMDAYAYFGIIDALMRLGVAFAIQHTFYDKLIFYAALITINIFVIYMMNVMFCKWRLGLKFVAKLTDKTYIKSILSFSGWSVLGAMALLLSTQGVNMIFNVFWGVAVNAAMGISQQASTALSRFISNFQVAFNPQLTKSYAVEGLSENTFSFMCRISKIVVILVFVIGYSLFCNIEGLLDIWLEIVPEYAVGFCKIAIILAAIEGCAGPLYILVYAKGDVKNYQIWLSTVQVLYVLATYVFCSLGYSPEQVLSINIISYIIAFFVRLYLLKGMMNFPISDYLRKVYGSLLLPLVLLFAIQIVLNQFVLSDNNIIDTLFRTIIGIVLSSIIMFMLYLNKEEKNFVFKVIRRK